MLRLSWSILIAFSLLGLFVQAVHSDTIRPREAPTPGVEVQDNHVSKILFLNRCPGGCVVTTGANDARFNTSAVIFNDTAVISEWSHGDDTWENLVECVKEIYAPYNVQITDVDPGNNLFHHEAIVAGFYPEIGLEEAFDGWAPAPCQPANNAISFTFANGFGDDPLSICHIVAQETAHSYGLEHAYDCSDPMTYLPTCGRKFFRDATVRCGEFEPLDQCRCGGTGQNSHRWLKTVLGESESVLVGPEITFLGPTEGSMLPNGSFDVSATVTHMRGIGLVQLWINGTLYGEQAGEDASSEFYSFPTPVDLADGIVDIEIRASDDIGTESSSLHTFQKGEPCTRAEACNLGQVCDEGRCIVPPPSGELGDVCVTAMECISGLCPLETDTGYCSQQCFVTTTENTCPSGFQCLETSPSNGVCWPDTKTGGCGCQSGTGVGSSGLLFLFLAIVAYRGRSAARLSIG